MVRRRITRGDDRRADNGKAPEKSGARGQIEMLAERLYSAQVI